MYNERWFTPLRTIPDAFSTNCTGSSLATFGIDGGYWQTDAEGFIRLFGLGQQVAAQRDQRLAAEEMEIAR